MLKGLTESILTQSVKNGAYFLYKQCLNCQIPYKNNFFFYGPAAQNGSGSPLCRSLTITQSHHIPYESSGRVIGRRTILYLTSHNTHNRQISMLPLGFEPAISASERPQTLSLDRAATRTGRLCCTFSGFP